MTIFIACNLTTDQSIICQQLCNWPIGYSVLFYFIYLLFCHTQWITSRIKTMINRLINIKFKIFTLLGRSDCGGEISEKPSLWGIEIFSLADGGFVYYKRVSSPSFLVWSQSLIVIITSWFAIMLDEIRTRWILREKGDCKQSKWSVTMTNLSRAAKSGTLRLSPLQIRSCNILKPPRLPNLFTRSTSHPCKNSETLVHVTQSILSALLLAHQCHYYSQTPLIRTLRWP